MPARPPDQPGDRIEGVPLADVVPGAKVTVLRFENEAEDLLHLFKDEGLAPGLEGKVAEVDADHVVVAFADGNATLTRSVVRDGLRGRRSVAAAAHRAARAARARRRSATEGNVARRSRVGFP